MPSQSIRKTLLVLSIAVALGCCVATPLLADGSRVEDLEARVAELEALVQQLLNQGAAPAQPSAAKLEAAAEAEQEHRHHFKFGGYVKSDVIYSDYGGGSVSSGSLGRDFYLAGTVPVGETGESYLDMHAKESRINFKSTHRLDNGKSIGTFVEMDFLVSGQGDERVSNSYSPRLRHAFFTYDKWLFGQTWMTFQNVAALPENLDFIGPAESTVFGRQAMIRYSNGPWQFAIENPETTVTLANGGRIVADDNRVPDFVARYNWSGDWGGITVAGILRQLRIDEEVTVDETVFDGDDSTSSYGISVSGKHMIGRDDFRWMVTSGKGLGRYLGLNTANSAVLDGDGNLHAIDSTGAFGSFRHFWSDKWRSNFTVGYLTVDNDVELTSDKVTKNAKSAHVNLIYTPVPKLDVGVEFLYADREIESGEDGDLKRVQFSAKYAY